MGEYTHGTREWGSETSAKGEKRGRGGKREAGILFEPMGVWLPMALGKAGEEPLRISIIQL